MTRDEEICSAIPLRMKRKLFVLENTEDSLKVKQQELFFTRPENNQPEEEVDVASCFQVTIEEAFGHEPIRGNGEQRTASS